jgi:hypothetical protein
MNISSIQINKNVFIPFLVLVVVVVAGCIWWSWAILVGAILGCLFGMMWGFEEVKVYEEDPEWTAFDEAMANMCSHEEDYR